MTKSQPICSLLAVAVAAGVLFLGSAGGALAHHHHHHHGDGWASGNNDGPLGTGPVHGPGSSHNPLIYHPAQSTTVVRDHRRPSPRPGHHYDPHCNHRNFIGCPNVRDHRKPIVNLQSLLYFL
jgi:hypothetical protein